MRIILSLLIFSTLLFGSEQSQPSELIETKAPGFRLATVNREGRHFTALTPHFSADSSNGVILSFYANWCAPCRVELPYLESIADSLESEGLRMIVVSVDSIFQESDNELLSSLGMNSPVVHDTYGIVASRYLYEGALPYSVFIDRAGVIQGVTTGFSEDEKIEIDRLISKILE